MRSILIVGAYGFLGSHITLSSLSENYEIILLIKKSSKSHRIPASIFSKTKVYYFDDIKLDELYQKNEISTTIFSAVKYDSPLKYEIYETNFLLPLRLIEYGRMSGCKNYIFFGSFFQKYPEYPIKKDYSRSKSFLNEVVKFNGDIRVFNLQLEHLYGPEDNPNKFIPWVLDSMKKNVPRIDLSDCLQRRDFIYVEDVVSLVCKIVEKNHLFSSGFHHMEVGTGVSIEIKDFLELLKKKLDSTSFLNYGSLSTSKREILDSYSLSTSVPKKLLWKPKYSLSKGIEQLIREKSVSKKME